MTEVEVFAVAVHRNCDLVRQTEDTVVNNE